ncbi:MAG TPA: hypothetical protein VI122_20875 [Thermoleophilaceae bacterium]
MPGPLRCLGSTQWGFLAEADHERVDALCRRVFAEPTGGEIDLRPLGSHVLVTLGRIERIVSEVAPFDSMGSSPESQAAVWIPVGRVLDGAVADQFLMFTPYMWVDNPISLPSGREMYGFAKAFGWMELPDSDSAPAALDVFAWTSAATRRPRAGRSSGSYPATESTLPRSPGPACSTSRATFGGRSRCTPASGWRRASSTT